MNEGLGTKVVGLGSRRATVAGPAKKKKECKGLRSPTLHFVVLREVVRRLMNEVCCERGFGYTILYLAYSCLRFVVKGETGNLKR